jgi:hypothetical protein
MDVREVAKGVVYMASLSLEANVQFMTVMATKMPYIRRGRCVRPRRVRQATPATVSPRGLYLQPIQPA